MSLARTRNVRPLILGLALAAAVTAPAHASAPPYLAPAERSGVMSWIPPRPQDGSALDAADYRIFWETRALVSAPRGEAAHADDVWDPKASTLRLAPALGVTIDPVTTPAAFRLLSRVQEDAGSWGDLAKGPFERGRVRPFVRFPAAPHCPLSAGDIQFKLAQTSSYPSAHTAYAWLWGLTLSELAPDRADALMAWAYDFGESRVVCGFHYESDVAAGRVAASALFARLQTNPEFQKDLAAARVEIARARAPASAPASARRGPLEIARKRIHQIWKR